MKEKGTISKKNLKKLETFLKTDGGKNNISGPVGDYPKVRGQS